MRRLENPCNIAYEYYFSGDCIPRFDRLRTRLIDIFIVNVEKSKIIDVLHTDFSEDYLSYLFMATDVSQEEFIQECLQDGIYRLVPRKEEGPFGANI